MQGTQFQLKLLTLAELHLIKAPCHLRVRSTYESFPVVINRNCGCWVLGSLYIETTSFVSKRWNEAERILLLCWGESFYRSARRGITYCGKTVRVNWMTFRYFESGNGGVIGSLDGRPSQTQTEKTGAAAPCVGLGRKAKTILTSWW